MGKSTIGWSTRFLYAGAGNLLYVFQELVNRNISVTQCSFERVPINLAMEWENYSSAVGVLHLNVAPTSADLHKSETL
ncbi:MAG: hypothetical protein NZ739_06450 [Verrucomicrobiae bacterium]|nr:hypothetical protein [Verrucomicrobiae bacterium]